LVLWRLSVRKKLRNSMGNELMLANRGSDER